VLNRRPAITFETQGANALEEGRGPSVGRTVNRGAEKAPPGRRVNKANLNSINITSRRDRQLLDEPKNEAHPSYAWWVKIRTENVMNTLVVLTSDILQGLMSGF
jgi:hypothetical protein